MHQKPLGQVVLPEVSVLPGWFTCPLGDLCSYHFTSHGYRKIYPPGALGLRPGQGVTPLVALLVIHQALLTAWVRLLGLGVDWGSGIGSES